jgi:regulator of nucleoside diphosphate kinase
VEIPADVVTMNSRVALLSRDHGATRVLTLAYAAQAAAEHGRVAVTSPLDRALVGQRVGEVIGVDQPGGAHRAWTLLRLEHQPEAAGGSLPARCREVEP